MIQSLTTEVLVLSALMKNPNLLLSFDNLKIGVFTTKHTKLIFKLICELYKNGAKKIDPADIWARAEIYEDGIDKLNAAGGLSFIETCYDTTDDYIEEIDVRHQVETLVECSCKRDLEKFAEKLIKSIEDNPEMTIDQAFHMIDYAKQDVTNRFSSLNKPLTIGDRFADDWRKLEELREGGFSGFPTCIPMLNRFFTYQPGELIIGHALAKTGKSFFVLNEAYNLAVLSGVPCAILDSELSTVKFMARMLARISGVSVRSIERGYYLQNPEEYDKVEEAKRIYQESPIYHCFMPETWTDDAVCTKIKQLVIQNDVQMIFVDYIKCPSVTAGEKESDVLGNFTQKVKDTIGVLNVPCLAMAQSSPYRTEPGMLRISDSRKVERYASTVFYIDKKSSSMYNDEMMECGGNIKIVVTHNRNGAQAPEDDPTCGINATFDWKIAKVTQAEYQLQSVEKMLDENE